MPFKNYVKSLTTVSLIFKTVTTSKRNKSIHCFTDDTNDMSCQTVTMLEK